MPRRTARAVLTTLLVAIGSLATAPAAVAADRDCGDFGSQRDAQLFFLSQGGPHSDPHRLDSDGDGIACETNPGPYYYGTTPPSAPQPQPQPEPQITHVRSSVSLALTPSSRIAGETFRVKVAVRPAISRKVQVQRRVDGRWRTVATGTTGRGGTTSGTLRAFKATVAYRAVVQPVTQGRTRYSAATSQARSLRVQRQRVVLRFDDRSVPEGEQVRASVSATPVRAGRTVVLQRRSAGSWSTVRTSAFDRRGRASFTLTPELGEDSYRAVAVRHGGAAAARSGVVTLTATDVTPPPAPYGLVAVPGDGAVTLSWSRTTPADFAHHEVWMRTADTGWSLVTVTGSDTHEVVLLANDVTHWFSVTSVDTRGNVSARSAEVAATPTAPEPEPESEPEPEPGPRQPFAG